MSTNVTLKDSTLANAESTVPGWRVLLNEYLERRRDDQDLSDMAIQAYWFADYLAKRRREALGVKFSEKFSNLKSLDKPINGHKACVTSYRDGHCTHAMIHTKLKKRKRYSLGSESLTVKQTQPSIFVILSTKESKESQICPNCGSESPTAECMNGCPYCGTKFNIKQYQNKISGEVSSDFESRVRAYFLAGKDDNIHFVSKVESSEQYADVADAMIVSYNKLLTMPSTEYQTIRAHMTVQLIRVKDGKLISEKLPFTADFSRNKESKTQALPDNEVFTCPSCAGAISILEGGHCRFCGTNTDLSKHGFTLQLMEPGWVA